MTTLIALGLFFLPGALSARYLRGAWDLPYVYVCSLLWLYLCILLLSAFQVSLGLFSLSLMLAGLSLPLGILLFRSSATAREATRERHSVLLHPLSCLLSMLILFFLLCLGIGNYVRAFRFPDHLFRWELLPRQMFNFGDLSFYPPITQENFLRYFYVDSIPPLVQFQTFWMYEAFAERLPALATLHSSFASLLCLLVIYRIVRREFSPTVALLSVLVFLSSYEVTSTLALVDASPLLILATLLVVENSALLSARIPTHKESMILAVACAIAGLSRMYGLVVGTVVLLYLFLRRVPMSTILVFACVLVGFLAPWYLRTFLATGNFFYPVEWYAGAPTNTLLLRIVEAYPLLNSQGSLGERVLSALPQLLQFSGVIILAGFSGVVLRKKKCMSLSLLLTFAWFAVWLKHTSFSYGVSGHLKAFVPILAVLATVAAPIVAVIESRKFLYVPFVCFLSFLAIHTSIFALTYPLHPQFEDLMKPMKTLERLAESVSGPERLAARVREEIGGSSRVLMHNAMLHAELIDGGIQAVPVWSPNLLGLANDDMGLTDGLALLAEQGISYVFFEGTSLNDRHLQEYPFYKALYESCYPRPSESRVCHLEMLDERVMSR